MTEVIALVASIAACLSAIAAFVVVRQNYKHRVASYRPELILVKKTVQFQSFDETGGLPRPVGDRDKSEVLIPIVNVGLGAARDLKVSWKFPIDQVVSSVNRFTQESLARTYFEYKKGFLSMKSEKRWVIQWKVEKEVEIDYVLPASIQQVPSRHLRLPMAYAALVLGYHHFAFKSQPSSIPDVPQLECRLNYVDVGGKKHKVDLMVAMEFIAVIDNRFRYIVHSSRRDA